MNVLELKSISVSLRLYIKKNGGNTMDKTLNIFYTGDNEPIAIAEVKASLEKIKGINIMSLEVIDAKRSCRNAYGQELSEDKFEAIDSDDEIWFDDYDFTIKAEVSTKMPTELLLKHCEDNSLSLQIL